MKRFPSVEDYIEVINGDRNPDTGRVYDLFSSTPPIVSLARYDVQILSSMSQTTQSGRPLTDRQAELAVKLVLKYRKQLEKLDIDVSPVEHPTYRLGIRQIDRRRLLYIEDNSVILKFPYETALINDLRELSKESQGRWSFDGTNKVWKIAITELNVFAVYGFARNNQFEIDDHFQKLYKLVLDCEAVAYEIKLIKEETVFTIQNAPTSLTQAIHNWCGFDSSNCDLLVDNSSIYGYTVDESILNDISAKYSPRICNLMTAQEIKFKPDSDHTVYKDVLYYAQITGRYPIYVYEPDMSDRLYKNFVEQYFQSNEIHRAQQLKPEIPTVHTKVIYFNKYSTRWDQPIPLLISGQGMMHGGEKSMLLQQAEKVVYFATEVYNSKTTNFKNNAG